MNVVYIHHGSYIELSDKYLPTDRRNHMVHSLIEAYGLLQFTNCVSVKSASKSQLTDFHAEDYVNLLEAASDGAIDDNEVLVDAGLMYDCPVKTGLFQYCKNVAGGTIQAAELLGQKSCQVALHWMGGWHHAQRSNAAGFCYVNDCVLGIIELRKHFNRVLYIDIDVHHGDGVQEAFYGTDKVFTVSIHRQEAGFYPGTGTLNESGTRKGRYKCINLPFKSGLQDKNFCDKFVKKFLPELFKSCQPNVVMLQMGADALNEDPMNSFSLTERSYIECAKEVMNWDVPLLITGGGGYNEANTARCWAAVTALVTNKCLPTDIPEHEYFLKYGPGYELNVNQSLKSDPHTEEYVDKIINFGLQTLARS